MPAACTTWRGCPCSTVSDLDSRHSIAWEHPAVPGTPWTNAFLPALAHRDPHKEFRFEVEGDEVSLLWHIPISDKERAYKQEHGADAFPDRLEAVNLPWVFDEANRPAPVE